MMSDTLLLGVLGAATLVLLFLFVIYRDSAVSKRLRGFELGIEEQNKYIYRRRCSKRKTMKANSKR